MKTLSFLIYVFLLISCRSWASDNSTSAADRLADVTRNGEFIKFYLISKTENYSFDSERIRQEATMAIERRCGANCHNFMRDIISHLRDSSEKTCLKGQEVLLVEIDGGHEITYSHSGREINFEGRCYINQDSIFKIVKDTGFLFK